MNDIVSRYKRQRRRIQAALRKLKKAGFTVDVELPKIPKRITEGSVRRLEKITTRSLQEKATKIDYDSGEIITARQAKIRSARARVEARRKSIETPETTIDEIPTRVDVLIDQIEQKISLIETANLPWFSTKVYNAMIKGFQDFLNRVDPEHRNTEEMINQLENISASNIFNYSQYASAQVNEAKIRADEIRDFADLVNSQPLHDAVDEMTGIEDADEFVQAEDVPIEFLT